MKHEEDILQRQVEAYLRAVGLKFVHVPKSLQRHIWSKVSRVPIHVAAEAGRAFKGQPDLLIFAKGVTPRCLVMELKTESGRLTPEQLEWDYYGMIVCRTFASAKKTIDDFNAWL